MGRNDSSTRVEGRHNGTLKKQALAVDKAAQALQRRRAREHTFRPHNPVATRAYDAVPSRLLAPSRRERAARDRTSLPDEAEGCTFEPALQASCPPWIKAMAAASRRGKPPPAREPPAWF